MREINTSLASLPAKTFESAICTALAGLQEPLLGVLSTSGL